MCMRDLKMDGDLKLFVLLCLLIALFPVQGYIFRVKSEASEKGVCITDEQSSAIAPIQPLNSALKTSKENGWLASLNESIDEFECIPNAKCKNWNLTNAKVKSVGDNFGIRFGHMDQTHLWNNFPEFKTDGNESFISKHFFLNHYGSWSSPESLSSLTLSILAEEAEILVRGYKERHRYSDKRYRLSRFSEAPGIILSLKATGAVWLTMCSRIFTIYNSICDEKHELSVRSKHDLGRKWVSIKITPNYGGGYWFQFNDESPMYVEKAETSSSIDRRDFTDFSHIQFRSKSKPGLFKLHEYYALGIQKEPFIFESHSIDLSKQPKIAFTYVGTTKINYSVVVDGSAQNVTTTSVRKNRLYIDYLQLENTSSALSNVTISLTTDSYNANLLSVGTVSKAFQGHRAIYMDGDLSACQIMSTGEVTSNIQNDTVAESLPEILFEDICNKLNAPNCRGVEACSPDGCFCFSGHTRSPLDGKCTQECDGNHYGPNCIHKANGYCKLQNFDVHTGFPNCEKTLEAPDEKVEVSDKDSYWIVLLLSTTALCLLQSLVMVFI